MGFKHYENYMKYGSCFTGCKFSSCGCGGSGSGEGIAFADTPSEFKLQNTIFINGSAGSWNGGFHLNTYLTKETTNIKFSYLFFDGNSGINGHDAGINAYNTSHGQFGESPFNHCFTTNIKNCLFYNSANGGSYKDDWFNEGTLNRYENNYKIIKFHMLIIEEEEFFSFQFQLSKL